MKSNHPPFHHKSFLQDRSEANDWLSTVIIIVIGGFFLSGMMYVLYPRLKDEYEKGQATERAKAERLAKTYTAQGVVLEKRFVPESYRSQEQFLIIYQNTKGSVFTIDNANIWAKAEKGDNIRVHYKYSDFLGTEYITFLDIDKL